MLKKVLAIAGLGALSAGAVIALPLAAHADALNGITSIGFVTPPAEVDQYQTFDMKATWAVPSTAKPGDTFSLTFPTELAFSGDIKTFELKDNSGASAATCVATSAGTPATSVITCTLSSYVLDHQNVQGNLYFTAQAVSQTTANTLSFTTTTDGGPTGSVDLGLPASGIQPPYQPPAPQVPEHIQKNWSKLDNGHFSWQLVAPSKFLGKVNGQDPVIHDVWDARMTLSTVASEFSAFRQSAPDLSVQTVLTEGTGPGQYTVTSTGPNSFDLVFHDPIVDDTSYYSYTYATVAPANAKQGNTYSNTMSLDQQSTTVSQQFSQAGGDANGNPLGGFSVTKSVTGSGAAAAAGASYTIDYSYSADGDDESGKLVVKAGETKGLDSIPDGTVVSLSEETPAPVAGISYQTAVFTGIGVVSSEGKATVTIGGGSTAAVALENPTTQLVGGISLTKSVTGEGASYVSGDAYTVDYSYGGGAAAKSGALTVKAGQSVNLEGIPAGTVVTLTEEQADETDEMYYDAPIFSGVGVKQTADRTATVSIGAGSDVAVQLENPTELEPGIFTLTKHVTGAGAQFVSGAVYTFDYSYVDDGATVTGSVKLGDGESWPSTDDDDLTNAIVDAGTVVTITEELPVATAGIVYGTPKFTGEGVVQDGRSATFTVGAGAEIDIDIENPTTVEDTTLVNTPGDPDTRLAFTGANAGPTLLTAGALVLGGVLAFAVGALTRRRRKRA